ncbi:hypothetical protein [Nocardia sp. SC052]|uniref:hypothetical protein n=1 Tax=Nocardia sichangensis TaxID=3385975 RepID=UPI0039A00FDB
MVDRRALPAAGLAQLLGVLALVAGVVAMHSAVFGHAHAAGVHTLAAASDAVADGLERAAAAPGFPHRHATPQSSGGAPTGHDRPQDRAHRDDRQRGQELSGTPGVSAPVVASRDSTTPPAVRATPGTDTPAVASRDSTTPPAVRATPGTDTPAVASRDSSAPRAVEASSGASWHATVAAKMSHCAGGGCDGEHSALHGCAFILAASIALAALVLLRRLAFDRPGCGAARPRHWRARRARPPPWTVLTLAELAILRI